MISLHGYYRSSTTYRLRIALELKGLAYEYVPVNLLKSEQKDAAFTSRNPFGSVPLLEVDGKDYVQSMAQIEWLDEAYPELAAAACGHRGSLCRTRTRLCHRHRIARAAEPAGTQISRQ